MTVLNRKKIRRRQTVETQLDLDHFSVKLVEQPARGWLTVYLQNTLLGGAVRFEIKRDDLTSLAQEFLTFADEMAPE